MRETISSTYLSIASSWSSRAVDSNKARSGSVTPNVMSGALMRGISASREVATCICAFIDAGRKRLKLVSSAAGEDRERRPARIALRNSPDPAVAKTTAPLSLDGRCCGDVHVGSTQVRALRNPQIKVNEIDLLCD